jgi:tetratricopeptide (TPR) repeat protein
MLQAALELLDRVIRDYCEASQLSSAWQQRGQCLVDLGRHDDAIRAFRAALLAQRQAPGWRNEAHLDLGELVVQLRRRELYPEAIQALAEFGGDEVFPVSVYRHAVTRALIADAMGESAAARGYAQQALAAAEKDESPFRYHRKLGLVRFVDPDVLAKLRDLCAA